MLSDVFFEAIAPSGRFAVDSSEPGVTTGLRVEFLIPMGVREAHEMVVTALPEFGFLGFDALGAGAHIGMWEFDFDDDGVFGFAGFTIDHFALGPDTAFSDSDDSGGLTPTDPTVSHALGTGGEHVFTIALPSGGDGDTSSCLSRFPTDIRSTLFSGIDVTRRRPATTRLRSPRRPSISTPEAPPTARVPTSPWPSRRMRPSLCRSPVRARWPRSSSRA